jgi:HD superfamily phosphohydrolase YqeK
MDIAEAISRIDADLDVLLKPGRAAHSRRVAALAEDFCLRFGLDPASGRLAGLAHDLCKALPQEKQWELARALPGFSPETLWGRSENWREDQLAPDQDKESERRIRLFWDQIVHGPAASTLLRERYGVLDPAILEAVALHSTGAPGMGALSALLFVADKEEPFRNHRTTAPETESMSLDRLLFRTLETSIEWLRNRRLAIAHTTLDLYNSLRTEAQIR